MSKKRRLIQTVAWTLAVLGLLISVGFLISVARDGFVFWGKSHIDFEKTGEFGDFIGGFVGTIFSAAGFVFLYLTLADQRDANAKERFESRFFELVEFHRENVTELTCDNFQFVRNGEEKIWEKVTYEKKQVFKAIFEQFNQVRNELKPFFSMHIDDIYLQSYLEVLRNNTDVLDRKIELRLLAASDINYSIVFYGVSAEGILILKKLFENRYKLKFISQVVDYIRLKPLRWPNFHGQKNLLNLEINYGSEKAKREPTQV